MKTRILTAGAILGALMLPAAANAQVVAGSIVGAAVGGRWRRGWRNHRCH
jgi:hypothetical protein